MQQKEKEFAHVITQTNLQVGRLKVCDAAPKYRLTLSIRTVDSAKSGRH